MKIALYIPPSPWLISDTVEIPLGILYIAAHIRRLGHKVEIIDMSGGRQLEIPEADIHGITFVSPQFILAKDIKNQIRTKYPDAKIIAGGPHATALPEEVIKEGFDCVVRGEGEEAITDILNNGITKPIYELSYLKQLTYLSFPAWDLINMESYIAEVNVFGYMKEANPIREINVLATRGCTGHCAYCTSFKGPLRFRKVSNVLEEILQLRDVYKVNRIFFSDDNIVINKNWLKDLCIGLNRIKMPWHCLGRADQIDYDTCKLMCDSGCRGIDFGIETGSQRLLDLVHKNTTVAAQSLGIKEAHRAGLKVRAQFMVGLPTESIRDHEENRLFILRHLDTVSKWGIHLFIPFPSSEIGQHPERFGYKIDKDTDYSNYQTIGKPGEWNFATKEDDKLLKNRLKELLTLVGNKNIFIQETPV